MAKKLSKYQTWQEVDSAMKELGELNIKKQNLEGEQTVRINEVKADILSKTGVLQTKIKDIEKNIERFAEQNKSEFLKTRNKKLTFGTISFRLVKSVVCTCKDEAIKALKALNLDFCLRQKEEIDKEKCLEVDEKMLLKAGISIKSEDKVKIEPNYIKLAADNQ